MAKYKVVEIFESINGEGKKAGQLAIFIRFKGCNLKCSYCDTMWANEDDAFFTFLTEDEIYSKILESKIKNITITGGEPLLQKDILVLLEKLANDDNLQVEIETNGSVDIKDFSKLKNPPSFTMDYKLPSSNMESLMNLENFKYLKNKDCVKFVVKNIEDLEKAKEIIKKYNLVEKCGVYLSPVYKEIELTDIVDFMKKNNLNGVNMQLQIHKIIWNPEMRGV